MAAGNSFISGSAGKQHAAGPLLHLEHARAPYAVELNAELAQRLLAAINAGAESGSEIGGLLIGSFPKAPMLTLRIEDFILLERRAEDEKRFVLSVEQRARLSTMRHRLLEQHRHVLGLFRSHLRKEKLVLSSADRDLLAGEFGRAIHVSMLVRAESPYAGAFFLPGGDGAIQAGSPPLPEFQFNLEELTRWAPRTASAVARSTGTAAEEPAAFVSIKPRRYGRWMAGAWAAVVLVCLSLTTWAPWTMRILFARTGLELRVQQHGDMLELLWNRQQPDLSRAAAAFVAIQDGESHRRFALTPSEIREGRIAYKPAGDRVTFRFSVPLADSAELVQVVSSGAAPAR